MQLAARHLLDPGAPFYGVNSDVISHFPVDTLATHHRTPGARVTVALAPDRSGWGVAELDGERIRRFVQSPRLPFWINAGVYLIEPEVVGVKPEWIISLIR
jgi:NDP-sugar pyrophosphorylase family protein